MPILRLQRLSTQDIEMRLPVWGRKKKYKDITQKKTNNMEVCEKVLELQTSVGLQETEQTTKYSLSEFIFRQNK